MTPREQIAMLRELVNYAENDLRSKDDAIWPDDMNDMLERMEGGRLLKLSLKQEGYVKDVYERVIGAPQYENLISSGKAPRGRDVPTPAVLLNLPLKPPGRR